ncbi:MAG: hypothetical protein PHI35_09635 [Victivallaceae bacterium]|nr:hypothetical protein [Victivallaceae bacterium]
MKQFLASALPTCVLFALLLGMCSCATVKEMPREVVDTEVKSSEHELCRALLVAFINDDAKGFIDLLPDDVRANFDRKQFQTTRSNVIAALGEPVSFQFVTQLEFITFKPLIWKVRFKRTDLKTGQEFYREALFRVVTGSADGKVHVISFNFL